MATIVMASQNVIDAAKATIAYIENKRNIYDEKAITKVMATKYGWFKKYYPTREQAIKILDSSDEYGMGWRSCAGWGDLDKAKNLLRLAQHGDPVTLNEDDVRVLF